MRVQEQAGVIEEEKEEVLAEGKPAEMEGINL